jgi:hypothetical protein
MKTQLKCEMNKAEDLEMIISVENIEFSVVPQLVCVLVYLFMFVCFSFFFSLIFCAF